MSEGPDRDKSGLWVMTAVRLAGIGIVLLGMWIIGQRPGDQALMAAGLVVMGCGGAFSLLAPRVVAQWWRK
jgi:hypothetical protein